MLKPLTINIHTFNIIRTNTWDNITSYSLLLDSSKHYNTTSNTMHWLGQTFIPNSCSIFFVLPTFEWLHVCLWWLYNEDVCWNFSWCLKHSPPEQLLWQKFASFALHPTMEHSYFWKNSTTFLTDYWICFTWSCSRRIRSSMKL